MTRKEFEQFISSQFLYTDRHVYYFVGETVPRVGTYKNPAVQLAWDVVQEAERQRQKETA